MKILTLQGSPRPHGYTQMVLERFMEGAISKGAEIDVVHLAKKRIKPCIGCYTCWFKTPGVCIHKDDDMPELLEKVRSCDVEVYATPLYHFGMTSYLKLFLERTLPLVQPWLIELDGITSHPSRYPDSRARQIVLISVCGFPEWDHFAALVENFRLLARVSGKELAGVLLRPGSEAMLFIERLGKKGQDVLQGFYQAGQEMVEKGQISQEIEEKVRMDWTKNRLGFQQQANLFWRIRMEHAERVGRGEEKRSFEEAAKNDIRLILGGMAASLNREAAGDLQAIIQFDISGEQPGQWHYEIKEGKCDFKDGKANNPALTIHTSSEVWLAIARGEIDGVQAFMAKKYTAEGDFKLMMRFKSLFSLDDN